MVAAKIIRVVWTKIVEFRVTILADIDNKTKAGLSGGGGKRGRSARWRAVVYQMLCPALVRGLVVHNIVIEVFVLDEDDIVNDVAWHSPAIKATHTVA